MAVCGEPLAKLSNFTEERVAGDDKRWYRCNGPVRWRVYQACGFYKSRGKGVPLCAFYLRCSIKILGTMFFSLAGKTLNDSYFSKGIHNFWIDQADGGTLGEPFENSTYVTNVTSYPPIDYRLIKQTVTSSPKSLTHVLLPNTSSAPKHRLESSTHGYTKPPSTKGFTTSLSNLWPPLPANTCPLRGARSLAGKDIAVICGVEIRRVGLRFSYSRLQRELV